MRHHSFRPPILTPPTRRVTRAGHFRHSRRVIPHSPPRLYANLTISYQLANTCPKRSLRRLEREHEEKSPLNPYGSCHDCIRYTYVRHRPARRLSFSISHVKLEMTVVGVRAILRPER